MRGKGSSYTQNSRRCGITPAYAGKRNTPHSPQSIFKDHPRLCGEKPFLFSICGGGTGSPPPMRGKDKSGTVALIEDRITPAYAGKRPVLPDSKNDIEDHPRLCGEKLNGTNGAECVIGSPPPMRGKDHQRQPLCDTGRITPAYAGKRHQSFPANPKIEDHPRLCGEKQAVEKAAVKRSGITPAYAGKRLTPRNLV